MTLREYASKYLEIRGLFPDQAQVVVQEMINDPTMKPIQGRLEDSIIDYPTSIVAILHLSLDDAAIRWIDANCPEAWFRPVFLPKTPNPNTET